MAGAPAITPQTQEVVEKWMRNFQEIVYRMRIHEFLEQVDWASILVAGMVVDGEPVVKDKLERMTKAMEVTSERMFPQLRPFFQSSKLEIRKIEERNDRLTVITRCYDEDGLEFKCRWWLAKAGDSWRMVDYENVTVSMRLTTLMSIAFQSQVASNPMAREVAQKFIHFGTLTQENDMEGALNLANELEKMKIPEVFVEIVQLAKADILFALDKKDEAASLLDQLEKKQCMNPAFFLLQAGRFRNLETYEIALGWAERYGKSIGHDGDSWRLVVNCHQELGRKNEALQAAKIWASDYPAASLPLFFQWDLLPTDRKRVEVLPQLMKLPPQAEAFDEFGEAALMEDDYEAIRLLVEVMKVKKMKNEEIAEWEEVLEDAPDPEPTKMKPKK